MSLPKVINDDRNYDAILEKVVLKNDLSELTPAERVYHIRRMCQTLSLNPETQPIQLIEFESWDPNSKQKSKKVIPYVSKDGGEQLRKLHKVSITKLESQVINGIYIAKAYAETPDGRVDCSSGAKSISEAKGKALENAIKIAETQAKRRVTLSICGLGFLDESEIESLPDSRPKKLNPMNEKITPVKVIEVNEEIEQVAMDAGSWKFRIEATQTLDDLKEVYEELKLSDMKKDPAIYKELIKLVEDCRLNIIKNTGEVAQ